MNFVPRSESAGFASFAASFVYSVEEFTLMVYYNS